MEDVRAVCAIYCGNNGHFICVEPNSVSRTDRNAVPKVDLWMPSKAIREIIKNISDFPPEALPMISYADVPVESVYEVIKQAGGLNPKYHEDGILDKEKASILKSRLTSVELMAKDYDFAIDLSKEA